MSLFDILSESIIFLNSELEKYIHDTIGVVPQNTTLFNDIIKNNISYGRREASTEDLQLAVKDAQLESFVESLLDDWESMVGDRGLKLSTCEKRWFPCLGIC